MSSRRRRQYFLSAENYGIKYVKKPKRTMINLHDNPSHDAEEYDSNMDESPNRPMDHVLSEQQPNLQSDTEEYDCSMDEPPNHTPADFDIQLVHLDGDEPPNNEHSWKMDGVQLEDDTDPEFPDHDTRSLTDVFSASINKKQFQCLSNLKYSDVLFMVLNFYIRHGLTQSALEDLLKLLNIIAGVKTFPESFQAFSTLLQLDPYNSYRVYFCTNCQLDFGTAMPEKCNTCPVCDCMEKDFFIIIPIEQQIRDIVIKHKVKIEKYAKTIDEKKIADINRGRCAKEKFTGDSRTVLTLSANTDGAAAYKCTTQKPLYPVFLTLNNLPPADRFSKHNLIINALWLSKGEPNTNLLFKYLCIELIRLENTGIKINGTVYSIMLLQVNLDSVARCKVQNMKQFNGNYGCTFCLYPGDAKESGTSRCYPIRNKVAIRQNTITRKHMDEVCIDGNERFGILGKTVFTSLSGFDVIASFPPDYMHAVLLGVMKHMWTMWTESENHKNPFYIGKSLDEVEKRLLSFRPPSSFSRYPRQLREYKKFKANEWEALLLHYIYPALVGILPQPYLDHIMLLSSSIFKLLNPKLNESDISICDKQLKQFASKFQAFYGKENMTYNVHLIGHLIEAVKNFGALYNFSLFPYESGNALLLGFRTGNNKPILQIERKYYMNRMCQYTELPSASPIQSWVKMLWTREHAPLQYDPKTMYNSCDTVAYDDDVEERVFSLHSRFHMNGLNLCTRDTCKEFNYDDSWVEINGSFYSVMHILCDRNNFIYIVGVQAIPKKMYDNLYSYYLSEVIRIIRVNDTINQCITMQIKNKQNVEHFISRCKTRTQLD